MKGGRRTPPRWSSPSNAAAVLSVTATLLLASVLSIWNYASLPEPITAEDGLDHAVFSEQLARQHATVLAEDIGIR